MERKMKIVETVDGFCSEIILGLSSEDKFLFSTANVDLELIFTSEQKRILVSLLGGIWPKPNKMEKHKPSVKRRKNKHSNTNELFDPILAYGVCMDAGL
jgi:hypothetical protein